MRNVLMLLILANLALTACGTTTQNTVADNIPTPPASASLRSPSPELEKWGRSICSGKWGGISGGTLRVINVHEPTGDALVEYSWEPYPLAEIPGGSVQIAARASGSKISWSGFWRGQPVNFTFTKYPDGTVLAQRQAPGSYVQAEMNCRSLERTAQAQ